jgi:hypothetical protein
VRVWAARSETPIGAVMPAANLWSLAHSWFEGRLAPDWKPRSIDQSQQLLAGAGFVGSFWSLAD